MSSENLIETVNLSKHFKVHNGLGRKRTLKAVDGVSLTLKKGETLGIVGESGCGKSTLGRTITRLYDASGGKILFEDVDITEMKGSAFRIYQKKMQIIFQDPYSSLNPSMNVREILSEPLNIHTKLAGKELNEKIEETLEVVGLTKASIEKFPHEFSGGQRQRIGIARAISVEPDFILCDEPISALDVSIQAQIVNTLEKLQEKMGVSYLFIAHDLSMVKHISHKIGVMYLGKIVEVSDTLELYKNPLHPYSQALLDSIPKIGSISNFDKILSGDIPSPIDLPQGCRFQSRCKYVMKKCREREPALTPVSKDHAVACHLYDEV
ncbi:ABC transporter ATP-binding protein [Oceanispirochaeta crateris]|uniref:ABC transporter ATP-binding protein n=1 Tax=Oceanispirochaeta crateris TaxID=2518645 RepID=A0A5C1QNX2_9SPIO|nr:ABC transporter ATP-binding protein [Oceanispirochaeta crateris]QEN08266.1 ABC transporter ATP-binding protein [Oceanispirochaeta crateris]